jgi:uncharacterized protein
MKTVARALLSVYRWTLSPFFSAMGAECRFTPSCSVYAEQAIDKYGVRHGSLLALKRLLRCHPWNVGGPDSP